ncbi:MAG: SMI1/KNR4 family protein [Rivularia sp. (in: Bacteria)]|nr:SMI1/KNR4 family protein [Rivularia sp. MS3]
MSQLTDSLNQIKTWLEENCPQAAESITPGLSLEEIESKIENLPFSLPEEFYELYQWSRGNYLSNPTIYKDIFGADDAMGLNTLEYAMEVFPYFEDEFEECAANYIGKPLFPIFGTDKTFLCIVGDWQDKTPSPIVYVSELRETEHRYVSLPSMMQTAAESIEANALNFNTKTYNNWNEDKYAEIYLKYNSNIVELSVSRLKQHLLISEPNSVSEEKAENNFIGDIANLYVKKQNLSSEQLDSQILEPLVIALEDEDERIRNLARKALEELG